MTVACNRSAPKSCYWRGRLIGSLLHNLPHVSVFSGASVRPYTGAVDCVFKMVSVEGFRSLYRGMGGMVYLALPRFALIFHANALGKKIYR